MTQSEKGREFRALHERDRAFIIPNPWDVGTARLLAHLGFEARYDQCRLCLLCRETGQHDWA
jgi:2-methylisocitrate lyase-like PEP mutase family enzyme